MRRVLTAIMGGMIGCVAGGVFGVTVGICLAPTREPRQPLAHEWYMMAVLQCAFWSIVGGGIIGTIAGAYRERECIWLLFAGLCVGLIAGYIAWDLNVLDGGNPNRPSARSYYGMVIIVPALAGAILGEAIGVIWSEIRIDLRERASRRKAS